MSEGKAAYMRLLGSARLQVGHTWVTFAPDKRQQLLAYLAYSGDWVSRERLAYLFWPDTSHERAQQNLRGLLHRVRSLDWLTGLEVEKHRLRWAVATDVARFRRALAEGNLDEALALYLGPLLEKLEGDGASEFSVWLEREREHLHARWRDALLRRARELREQGNHGEAARLLTTLLDKDPLDEEALAAYLDAAARAGQQDQAARVYRLFASKLHEELGLKPTSATQRLAQAVQEGKVGRLEEPSRTPPLTLSLAPFPAPVTSFVGRDLELSEIAHLLANPECRLLTLTGPGGIGKTRLALRAVEELAERFPDGSHSIALGSLSSPEAVATAVAGALELELMGQDEPLQQLIRAIGKGRMLLVLDNFEHLLEGAALASRLVQACPNLKLLVTSRERLDLTEEWLLAIEGLPFPTESTAMDNEALSADAVALFLQRASQVCPTFTPTEEDITHIVRICRLVQGMPLGIELAAVWVRVMTCREIAQEIRENIDILSTSARNIPERHKSIRATFEQSWNALAPVRQEVLRRLAVFRGGFRKEAAAVVAGASIAVLASLVDKSLLRVTSTGRYDRHPLVHGYTREKLAEHPEEEAEAKEKHAAFYVYFLQEWGKGLLDGKRKEALKAIEDELENIHAAWYWAVDEARVEELQQASEPLHEFYDLQGRYQEGLNVFGYASARLSGAKPDHHAALGNALIARARFCLALGRYQEVNGLARQGLALLRPLGENRGAMWGLLTLGTAVHWRGEHQQAERYLHEALALARALQDHAIAARCLHGLVDLSQDAGSYAETARYANEAIALYRQVDDHESAIKMLDLLGLATLRMGKPREAQTMIEGALQHARERGATVDTAHLTAHLGLVAYALRDYAHALSLHLEALRIIEELPEWQRWGKPLVLADAGRIEIALGRYQEAEECLLRSLRIALPHHWLLSMLSALAGLVELRAKRGNHEAALELAALVIHHPATEYVHRERTEGLAVELRGQLPAQAVTRVMERGKTRNLEEVVEEILR